MSSSLVGARDLVWDADDGPTVFTQGARTALAEARQAAQLSPSGHVFLCAWHGGQPGGVT